MVARLGEFLVQEGACTAAAVQEALQSQAIFGGRLGTNLLEQGALTEEALALALGRHTGAPALYGELSLDAHALRLIDRKVADRWDVVPFLVVERKLAVLARDPHDLRMLDEVAFAAGRAVHAFVVPEARIWHALRAAYGLDREHRGLASGRRAMTPPPMSASAVEAPGGEPELMDEAEFQSLYGREAAAPTPPPARGLPAPSAVVPIPAPAAAQPSSQAVAHHLLPAILPPPLLLDAMGPLVEAPGHPPPPAPPRPAAAPVHHEVHEFHEPSPLSFEDALRFLEGVESRSTIARTVLRHARTRFARAVLFTVHHGEAHGWAGLGAGLTPEAVHALRIPLGLPGILDTVVTSQAHFLGPIPKTWTNVRLLKGLGGGVPGNALLVPIVARGRVVNVLYGDRGRGALVDPAGLGELLVLAARIAQSYDALASRAV